MKPSKQLVVFLFILSVALTACDSHDSATPSDGATHSTSDSTRIISQSYQFQVNGCDTGYHTASSSDEYCSMLSDSSLNNGCAADMRLGEFGRVGCTGAFGGSAAPTNDSISSRLPYESEISEFGGATQAIDAALMVAPQGAGVDLEDQAVHLTCGSSRRARNIEFMDRGVVVTAGSTLHFHNRTTGVTGYQNHFYTCSRPQRATTGIAGLPTERQLIRRELHEGQSILEVPFLIHERALMLSISCVSNAVEARLNPNHGLSMTPGSSVLLRHDTHYLFGDGTYPIRDATKPYVLVTCAARE